MSEETPINLMEFIQEYIKENQNHLTWRLTYGTGNGYHCSCCRSTDTNTKDFNELEDLFRYVADMSYEVHQNKVQQVDFWVEDITLIFPPFQDDHTFIFPRLEKYKEEAKDKLQKDHDKTIKHKKARKKIAQEQKEKKLLEELKKKYEK